jgi:tetratricopeptide (TPR) repeat protein
MTAEIEKAKYSEIETLMTKDVAVSPSEPILWLHLAQAETGLKNYLDAETNFKKALDLESRTGKPEPEVMGVANAGLGEVYARTLMVDEANAAFDAAARTDPARAATYLKNQAIIFFQEKNAPAQVDAADKAIKADPRLAVLYYIKAQGLAENATVDPKSNKIALSPDCVAAYRRYLELDPNGQFADDATGTLQRAGESVKPKN